jgi:hypothetical protein
MKNRTVTACRITFLVSLVFLAVACLTTLAGAQNPELQQKVAEIKEASARNKQALAQYTWQEQVTISLKGEQKKQEHFQVRLGPDGKPQKTSLDPTEAAAPQQGGHRLKEHVVEKKKEEYKEYADQMKELAQQYVPPDRELLEQAYEKGNITLGTAAGNPDQLQLVIHNYLKPQDSMTLVFDKAQKELLSVQVASYMDDPKDAMNLTVRFSRLPDGTNHISGMNIDGISKQLSVATENSNYQHL